MKQIKNLFLTLLAVLFTYTAVAQEEKRPVIVKLYPTNLMNPRFQTIKIGVEHIPFGITEESNSYLALSYNFGYVLGTHTNINFEQGLTGDLDFKFFFKGKKKKTQLNGVFLGLEMQFGKFDYSRDVTYLNIAGGGPVQGYDTRHEYTRTYYGPAVLFGVQNNINERMYVGFHIGLGWANYKVVEETPNDVPAGYEFAGYKESIGGGGEVFDYPTFDVGSYPFPIMPLGFMLGVKIN